MRWIVAACSSLVVLASCTAEHPKAEPEQHDEQEQQIELPPIGARVLIREAQSKQAVVDGTLLAFENATSIPTWPGHTATTTTSGATRLPAVAHPYGRRRPRPPLLWRETGTPAGEVTQAHRQRSSKDERDGATASVVYPFELEPDR